MRLVRKKLNNEVDERAAIDLVYAFDYILLAMNQVAVYINRCSLRVTAESYLNEIRKSEKRRDSLFCSDKGDIG